MSEVTTPSGLVIGYVEKPRRQYTVNGNPVPSVTQVLGVLDKPALVWWGQTTGLEGFCKLAERWGWLEDGLPKGLTAKKLTGMLTREKLTVNHVRNQAGDRGKAAHDALESILRTGEPPDEREYPPGDRGFVRAVRAWYDSEQPEFLDCEVMVASLEHGFGGRFDFFCRFPDGTTARGDAKTSKKLYPETFLQLEAYELAAVECGYEASDVRLALRLSPDGNFEVQRSYADGPQFLAVLEAWKAVADLRERAKVEA